MPAIQQFRCATADRRPFRRRATTLAVLLMLAGSARRFDVPTGSPDLALRCDNTSADLGFRTQSQDPILLRVRTSTTAIATSADGSIVAIASTCLQFDLMCQRGTGSGSAPPDGYDDAYGNLDDDDSVTRTRSGWTPARGHTGPYTKRYAKGLYGEFLDAFTFTTFDVADVPVDVKAGQHTVYWGEGLLLGGAVHGISYRRTRSTCGRASRRPAVEAKELLPATRGASC